MWTEHVVASVLDYVVWPRAAALGEKLWSPEYATRVGVPGVWYLNFGI